MILSAPNGTLKQKKVHRLRAQRYMHLFLKRTLFVRKKIKMHSVGRESVGNKYLYECVMTIKILLPPE